MKTKVLSILLLLVCATNASCSFRYSQSTATPAIMPSSPTHTVVATSTYSEITKTPGQSPVPGLTHTEASPTTTATLRPTSTIEPTVTFTPELHLSGEKVRLFIINKSGYEVFMQLVGKETNAYYYFSLPSGTTTEPITKIFVVFADYYQRKTWQCNGIESTGTLIITGNIRLTFTPCQP